MTQAMFGPQRIEVEYRSVAAMLDFWSIISYLSMNGKSWDNIYYSR